MASKKKILVISIAAIAVLAIAAAVAYPHLAPPAPSERRMARIMADIYTADAILQEAPSRGQKDKTIEQTYHTVLSHYEMTKAEYDSAVAWYARQPKKFASVYERVVAILTQREAMVKEVAERVDSIEKRVQEINDSLTTDFIGHKFNINLPLKPEADSLKTYLKPNAKKYTTAETTLDFDTITIKGGHLDVAYKYTISNPGDKTKTKPKPQGKPTTSVVTKYPDAYLRVIVSYADTVETRDSVVIAVSRRVTQRNANLTVNLRDSVQATKARVVFFENKNLKDMEMVLREISLTYKPYDVVDTTNYDSIIPSLFAY